MTTEPTIRPILLVDDGELDEVAAVLESQGQPFTRLRGGGIPAEIAPPRDLLIITPRHVERVRRGSPPGAAPGTPLRIIAVREDSPAMRRRLRRSGLHLLVRLPANAEIWRLLIARALYRGQERREDPRVAVGAPVLLAEAGTASARETSSSGLSTILLDLSNRGCRLQTPEPLGVEDPIRFTIPPEAGDWGGDGEPLTLRGRVRRLVQESSSPLRTLAIIFDEDLPDLTRARLTGVLNRWASGPSSLAGAERADAPTLPPCRSRALPDLMLDDETDPPLHGRSEVRVRIDDRPGAPASESEDVERRRASRARFEAAVLAESADGPLVLVGRDLSAGGMLVERTAILERGDRFRLALHGPGPGSAFIVEAEVVRDDGRSGFALAFRNVDPETSRALEKTVACLPPIESLEDGEIGGMGAILSEIIRG